MSIETRNGRQYYYGAKRSGDKIVKTYFGSGVVAELAANQDAEARDRRLAVTQALAQQQDVLRPADRSLADLDQACDRMLTARLIAAGYHRCNSGPWRRRRDRA